MKNTRAITVGLTFVAGLYFILDFIVPPTLPGASTKGVVLDTTPATFSAASPTLPPNSYTLAGQGNLRPKIMVSSLDILGKPKLTAVPLRQVGPGVVVTIRTGPFEVKKVIAGTTPTIETLEGARLALVPGQQWIDGTKNSPVTSPLPGMTLILEQANAKITTVNPGSADLLVHGQRVNHRLGTKTAVIKVSRYGDGAEVPLDELKTGDTAIFGPATTFADNRDTAAQFNLVITTMAFGIGLISLGTYHGKTMVKRRPGWYVSAFFFVAVVLGIGAGIGKYDEPGTSGRAFSDFVILRLNAPVYSTIFSLLAFYMAAAAYRAFRIRTGEAALMLTSALLVMLGQTPFGIYLSSWMGERYSALWIPNIAAWILRVPNTAMFRGLIFGVMLGAIATALRFWLSMERSVSSGE